MSPHAIILRRKMLLVVLIMCHSCNEHALLCSAAYPFRREIKSQSPPPGEEDATLVGDTSNGKLPPSSNTLASQSYTSNRIYPTILPENISSIVSRISSASAKRLQHTARQQFLESAERFWNTKRPLDSSPLSEGGKQQRSFIMTSPFLSGGAEPEPQQDTTSATMEGAVDRTETVRNEPAVSAAFLGNLEKFRQRSLQVPQSFVNGNDDMMQKVRSAAKQAKATSSRIVPSFVTALSLLYTADKGISFTSMYALALLGASCGFHLFLHFITIGYALGIGLPMAVALVVYNKHSVLPWPTFLHSLNTVAWSLRMLAFFVWREYVSWPALHEKVVEIQQRMKIPFASRMLCWLVYSFFYLAMVSMPWSRLHQGANAKWGIMGILGLVLQIGGLSMESVADLQKNGFKSHHRHSWCNIGLWKWSTHPNYLGEGFFWWGTYLGHGFYSLPRTIFATIGLGFIMSVLKGSTKSLSIKHMEKYGDQSDFFEFQRTHSIWGPKQWWWWLHGMEHLSEPTMVDFSNVDGNGLMNTTNTSSTVSDDATSVILSTM